jgi:hypothetical protein
MEFEYVLKQSNKHNIHSYEYRYTFTGFIVYTFHLTDTK